MARQTDTCHVPECDRPAWSGGLCPAHLKRRQRGKPLSGPVRTRRAAPDAANAGDLLRDAALDYAEVNAESDADFTRADTRLLEAALARAQAAGWSPPKLDKRDLSKSRRGSVP